MKRDIASLANKEYDLIVVGGGIFGICSAWEAASRGLSVALLDQGDFGHATSANHFKVVHGGIRYLQHADIARVRESSAERSAFLRIAPHLVYPMPYVMPTYGHGMKGREVMQVGVSLYNLCTFDRNQGIKDSSRHIPNGYTLSRKKTLEMFPHLNPKGLTGAAVFHDGQMYNPARLSLAFVQSAVEAGADVANYAEVVHFLRSDDEKRVTGVAVHDRLSGDEFEVRGKMVLNATGPWAKWLLGTQKSLDLHKKPSFSRDAYFVIEKKVVSDHALAVEGHNKDSDAVLSRGNRMLLLVPWRDYTLVGVWHVVFKGKPEEFTVTEEDLLGFIDEINSAYPGSHITLDDVTMWNAGLTLFGDDNDPESKDLSFGKRSLLIDHEKDHGIEGVISLIGVRYTTGRGMAEKAVNLALKKMGKSAAPSTTATTPIHGGDFDNFANLVSKTSNERPESVDAEMIPALVHNYGTKAHQVLSYAKSNPKLGTRLGESKVLQAEVIHAVQKEMAERLSDVVFRRTDLGSGSHPGKAALQTCADLMAQELQWDETRKQQELDAVEKVFPKY